MPSALQRKIRRHNPLCAASRLGIQAMASLPKASRAEFSHPCFLLAAETCLQIFRFLIGARRSVSGQTSQRLQDKTHRSSAKYGRRKMFFFCRFGILGEPLTIRIWWFKTTPIKLSCLIFLENNSTVIR